MYQFLPRMYGNNNVPSEQVGCFMPTEAAYGTGGEPPALILANPGPPVPPDLWSL